MRVVGVSVLFLASGALSAQHGYSPTDIDDGRRLYRANCVLCHGPEGESVPGVDLGHGKFRRGTSDGDIIQIIRFGIPGTPMPPHNLTTYQAAYIVSYLRFMATTGRSTSAPGDAVRGQAVLEGKGGCLHCHRVKDQGSRVGPDLSDIGAIRRSGELERSILEPDAEVLPQNRYVRVVTRDGAKATGRLLNQDAFTVQLLDTNERLMSFVRSNIAEYVFVDKSPMPSYRGKLSAQEVSDVVSYLVSLKGIDNP